MLKICSGCYLVPTYKFFPKNTCFFLNIFGTHRFFSRKYDFFPLKFGHLPTFPLKINIYLYFDSWTSRRPIGVRDCVIACTPPPPRHSVLILGEWKSFRISSRAKKMVPKKSLLVTRYVIIS